VSRDVLVVGAGMAGLTLATARAAAGDRVTVVDKGRRHGGRMATRRADDVAYDTGVPTFAAHSDTFRAAVADWVAQGHAEELPDAGGGARRVRGRPTMRSLPTALAETSGAEVVLATTVVGLDVTGGRWHVAVEEGRDAPSTTVRTADVLVLTCPAPQAVTLLRGAPGLADPATLARLEAVSYAPCLAVLARPSDPAAMPAATGVAAAPRTILADATFSAAHLDGDRAAAARYVAIRASEQDGVALEVVHVHGWRYAQVARGLDVPALRDDTAGAPLVIAGDLCTAHVELPDPSSAEGVERAFLSGRAAAALVGPRSNEEAGRWNR